MALDVAESTLKRRAEAHLRGVEGSRGAPEAAAAAGRRRQQQARAGERKKVNGGVEGDGDVEVVLPLRWRRIEPVRRAALQKRPPRRSSSSLCVVDGGRASGGHRRRSNSSGAGACRGFGEGRGWPAERRRRRRFGWGRKGDPSRSRGEELFG